MPSNYRVSVLADIGDKQSIILKFLSFYSYQLWIADKEENRKMSCIINEEKAPDVNFVEESSSTSGHSSGEVDNDLQFSVQIKRVTGVPSEEGARKEDILIRGVNFGLVRTNKPPTKDEAGRYYTSYRYILGVNYTVSFLPHKIKHVKFYSDPEFIGNIVRLHANIDSRNDDVWEFGKSETDPDNSCYIRITSEALGEAKNALTPKEMAEDL